jgi:hypothetical protein
MLGGRAPSIKPWDCAGLQEVRQQEARQKDAEAIDVPFRLIITAMEPHWRIQFIGVAFVRRQRTTRTKRR